MPRICREEMMSHMMLIKQKEVKSSTSFIWHIFKQFIVFELEYSLTVLLFFYRYLREDLSINRMHQLYLQTHEPEVWNRPTVNPSVSHCITVITTRGQVSNYRGTKQRRSKCWNMNCNSLINRLIC